MNTPQRPPVSVRLEDAASGPAVRIVVSAKTAPLATARNRARRRIRETLRALHIRIPEGSRATFIVHTPSLPPPAQLTELLVLILKKSGIVHR